MANAPTSFPSAIPLRYFCFWASLPNIIRAPPDRELGISWVEALASTLVNSSVTMVAATVSPPQPPYSLGITIAWNPQSMIFLRSSSGYSPVSSICAARGAISFSANSLASFRIISCFLLNIPFPPVSFHFMLSYSLSIRSLRPPQVSLNICAGICSRSSLIMGAKSIWSSISF